MSRVVDDAAVAGELAVITERLQALASGPPSPTLGRELGQIRAALRQLARDNDEVGRWLETQLGAQPPGDPAALQ